MKKYTLFAVFLCLVFLFGCSEVMQAENETKNVCEPVTYTLVEPTHAELQSIQNKLGVISATTIDDYNCETDNAYQILFYWNELDYHKVPPYNEELKKYICEPVYVSENGSAFWNKTCYEKDPYERFGELSSKIFNQNGAFDEHLYYKYCEETGNLETAGYNKYNGEFLDWLIEGVWNGKVDHKTFFEFEDTTKLYYHNGNYYSRRTEGGRGGGIFYAPVLYDVIELGEHKYEAHFVNMDDFDQPAFYTTMVIGMKESSNGFRFWSIYSIDYEKTKTDDNDLMSYGIPFGLFYEYSDSVIYPEKDDYSYIRINFDESREVSGYARLLVSTPGEADGYIDSNGAFYTELPNGGKCSHLRDWQDVDIPQPEGINQIYGSPYETSLYRFIQGDRYGYLNTDGEIVIEAQFYEASDFSEGLAAICREDGGCLEYINENGETVIKLDGVDGYQNIFRMIDEEPSCDFSDGVALIYCGDESFCIDKDGNRLGVKNPVGMHKQGLIAFRDKDTELYGFADKDGNIVIPATYSYAYDFSSSGIALVYSTEKHYPPENPPTFLNESYYRGFIDTTGNVVIPLEFEQPFYLQGMKLFFESFESYGIVSLYKQGYTYYYRCDGTLLGKSPRMAYVWYEQKSYPINVAEYWQWVNDGKPVG